MHENDARYIIKLLEQLAVRLTRLETKLHTLAYLLQVDDSLGTTNIGDNHAKNRN